MFDRDIDSLTLNKHARLKRSKKSFKIRKDNTGPGGGGGGDAACAFIYISLRETQINQQSCVDAVGNPIECWNTYLNPDADQGIFQYYPSAVKAMGNNTSPQSGNTSGGTGGPQGSEFCSLNGVLSNSNFTQGNQEAFQIIPGSKRVLANDGAGYPKHEVKYEPMVANSGLWPTWVDSQFLTVNYYGQRLKDPNQTVSALNPKVEIWRIFVQTVSNRAPKKMFGSSQIQSLETGVSPSYYDNYDIPANSASIWTATVAGVEDQVITRCINVMFGIRNNSTDAWGSSDPNDQGLNTIYITNISQGKCLNQHINQCAGQGGTFGYPPGGIKYPLSLSEAYTMTTAYQFTGGVEAWVTTPPEGEQNSAMTNKCGWKCGAGIGPTRYPPFPNQAFSSFPSEWQDQGTHSGSNTVKQNNCCTDSTGVSTDNDILCV